MAGDGGSLLKEIRRINESNYFHFLEKSLHQELLKIKATAIIEVFEKFKKNALKKEKINSESIFFFMIKQMILS